MEKAALLQLTGDTPFNVNDSTHTTDEYDIIR
jgi:hypothetical protein